MHCSCLLRWPWSTWRVFLLTVRSIVMEKMRYGQLFKPLQGLFSVATWANCRSRWSTKKPFAGLVQRAWKHEVLQDYNRCTVKEGHAGFYMALELGNYEFPEKVTTETDPQLPPRADQVHACLKCQRAFCTRTAWALHAFKKHRRINGARRFASGSYCMSCGTEYWEHKRWLLHLRYSGACRRARKAESA